jgi:hypothetical protein
MRGVRSMLRNERGGAALSFALAAPVLILALVGIAQLGILFMANAGLRNAVGEGARHATIYPRPSDAAIIAEVTDSRFGLKPERIEGPTIVHGTDAGADYIEITMGYSVPLDFIFFSLQPVELTETRRAFVYPS